MKIIVCFSKLNKMDLCVLYSYSFAWVLVDACAFQNLFSSPALSKSLFIGSIFSKSYMVPRNLKVEMLSGAQR
jgi:hypothetical protein